MSTPLQEPPFPVPFVDDNKIVNPIWQLWLFNNQSGLNLTSATASNGVAAAGAAQTTANGAVAAAATAQATANAAATPATVAAETARAEAAEALLAPKASPTFTGVVTGPVLELTGATPTGAGIGFGNTQGIGNGASGNVTAPALGTGTGPATPGTVVNWLEIDIAGTKAWIPLCQ
jgi:hypothetical protein